MNEEYVSLKDLSTEMGMDRSQTRKYVIKIGVTPHKRRIPGSAGQPSLVVTPDEAKFIRERRAQDGYSNDGVPVVKDTGVFYVIRLVPELDSKRIKMGFAEDLDGRLAQHRTAAPTAVVVRSWPCKRSWESTIMDCLSSYGCELILNEVFECKDVDKLVGTGDTLFSLIPNPDNKIPIANVSPHKH